MSELIAAKAKGELLERYQRELERLDEDTTESELIRELLREGLDAKEAPLFARIDLPDKYAARVEAEREVGESDEELLRRLLRDLVQSWDDDVLDEVGVSDELREAVEEERADGETLDGAVERLLRRGVEAREGPLNVKARLVLATAFSVAGAGFVYAWVLIGTLGVVFLSLFFFLYLIGYPRLESAAMSAVPGRANQ